MAKLKKYMLSGEESGEVELDESCLASSANSQMVKDYIVALRRNARQWSASTQGRSEVCHSNQKPHKQKGLGRARQGRLSSPQYKGGGVVFGPKPKFDQHVKINRKERRQVIRTLLLEKLAEGKITVVDVPVMEQPKTKTVASYLKARDIVGKRTLFLGEGEYLELPSDEQGDAIRMSAPTTRHRALQRSISNIPRVEFMLANCLNGYDLMKAHELVVTEAALRELESWLKTS